MNNKDIIKKLEEKNRNLQKMLKDTIEKHKQDEQAWRDTIMGHQATIETIKRISKDVEEKYISEQHHQKSIIETYKEHIRLIENNNTHLIQVLYNTIKIQNL